MFYSILAISLGSSIGAVLRWFLGTKLNTIYPDIPLGTLSANLIGGYLVGISIAFFASTPAISPEWKLFVVTGFLGGLTTFSTFSAEIVALFQSAKYMNALVGVLLHTGGSFLMTFAGLATYWLAVRFFGIN